MREGADISLAMHLEDVTILECIFHAEASTEGRNLEQRFFVDSPERRFTLDVKRRKNVLRAMVGIQFALLDKEEMIEIPDMGERPLEIMHFGLVAGIVISSPLLGDSAIAPMHLAGEKTAEDRRDEKMERAMLVEAIKTACGLATTKLAEMSAMSPTGSIMLPLIDSEEMLDDLVRRANSASN